MQPTPTSYCCLAGITKPLHAWYPALLHCCLLNHCNNPWTSQKWNPLPPIFFTTLSMPLHVLVQLLEKKLRLRIGQADDALNAVHKQLHIASMIIEFKRGQHYTSQNLTHKMQMMIGNFHKKTQLAAVWYQAAFAALMDLNPSEEWMLWYQPLDLSKDLHLPRWGLNDPCKGRNQGENKRKLSWIWLVMREGCCPAKATDDEVSDGKSILWLEFNWSDLLSLWSNAHWMVQNVCSLDTLVGREESCGRGNAQGDWIFSLEGGVVARHKHKNTLSLQ